MLPYELIRAAAEVIKTSGWWSGPGHAADHAGNPVGLFDAPTGGTSRAAVNKHAARFSIYGALVKAQADAGQATVSPGLMWDTLYRMGMEEGGIPQGGVNYVHPIIAFNEMEGQTKEKVLAFLEKAAVEIEQHYQPISGHPGPPLPAGALMGEYTDPPPNMPPPDPTHRVIGQTGFPKELAAEPKIDASAGSASIPSYLPNPFIRGNQ